MGQAIDHFTGRDETGDRSWTPTKTWPNPEFTPQLAALTKSWAATTGRALELAITTVLTKSRPFNDSLNTLTSRRCVS
jgi:hypothetical protein